MKSVWEMIYDDPADSEVMRVKSNTLVVLAGTIQKNGLTKAMASKIIGVDPFSLRTLLEGSLSGFSQHQLDGYISHLVDEGCEKWEFPS